MLWFVIIKYPFDEKYIQCTQGVLCFIVYLYNKFKTSQVDITQHITSTPLSSHGWFLVAVDRYYLSRGINTINSGQSCFLRTAVPTLGCSDLRPRWVHGQLRGAADDSPEVGAKPDENYWSYQLLTQRG